MQCDESDHDGMISTYLVVNFSLSLLSDMYCYWQYNVIRRKKEKNPLHDFTIRLFNKQKQLRIT